ncbi:hypothetical protein MRX96_040810 [Rhipicephalus microplus]
MRDDGVATRPSTVSPSPRRCRGVMVAGSPSEPASLLPFTSVPGQRKRRRGKRKPKTSSPRDRQQRRDTEEGNIERQGRKEPIGWDEEKLAKNSINQTASRKSM